MNAGIEVTGDRLVLPRIRRMGFTLIELLAVMAIMILLAGATVMAYFGATRGAGMRSAVSNLRGTLMLARQGALTKGKKTYVFFSRDGYTICQKAGQSELGYSSDGSWIYDKYADWRDVRPFSTVMYNLTANGTTSVVVSAPSSGTNMVQQLQTREKIWSTSGGEDYGFEVNAKTFLPRGYFFCSSAGSGTPSIPARVVFNGDGTTSGETTIYVFEGINAGYTAALTIQLSGYVDVSYSGG